MERIKKNDTVAVCSGKDKGKKGKVIAISHKKDKVMVKDIAIVVKHQKARKQGEKSGIVRRESFIPLAKVMPICTSCSVPTRVGSKIEQDMRVRTCKKCQQVF
jgi:large subunit ribosomal protein L24